MQARGLKHVRGQRERVMMPSRLMQARGLKPGRRRWPLRLGPVAPRAGAWIAAEASKPHSYILRTCELKHGRRPNLL